MIFFLNVWSANITFNLNLFNLQFYNINSIKIKDCTGNVYVIDQFL